jgi:hypothetical protein
MTTAVMDQPTAAAKNPRRLTPIVANLLPPEIVAARRGRRARRLVLAAMAILLVAMAGWYALAVLQTGVAQGELTRTQNEAVNLTRQNGDFAALLDTQHDAQTINDQLADLLADDLRWPLVLSAVREALPPGVKISTVIVGTDLPGEGAEGAASGDAGIPSTAEAKTIGTIDISGSGPTKSAIAAYVDALASAEADGLADPFLGAATESDGGLTFTIQVNVTATALGGRYAKQSPKEAGR